MRLEEIKVRCDEMLDELETVIVGKRPVLENVVLCALCNGHLLFEDYPGLAKTMIASSFARSAAATSIGSSSLRTSCRRTSREPTSWTGTSEFSLRKGPCFTNVLMADEINRAPPKTQSALLEAMQEKQVTLEGETHRIEEPFIVLATQNPIEYEGTYPLPEAQLDRFLMRTRVGYPTKEQEMDILKRRRRRMQEKVELKAVIDPHILLDMQKVVEGIHVDDSVDDYAVSIVTATRSNPNLELGASPRGSLALMRLARPGRP